MALVVGTNSWATETEADDYLTDRIDAGSWFNLTGVAAPGENSKESLLVSAFRWLISSPLLTLSVSSTNSEIKNAQIEASLYLLQHYREMDERRTLVATGVGETRLSRKWETLSANNLAIPDHILGYLVDYVTGVNAVVQLGGHYDA